MILLAENPLRQPPTGDRVLGSGDSYRMVILWIEDDTLHPRERLSPSIIKRAVERFALRIRSRVGTEMNEDTRDGGSRLHRERDSRAIALQGNEVVVLDDWYEATAPR